MTQEFAALYVVATPIGNLGDITLRALETLKSVAWVAAEDTRHSAPLLQHYGIQARLLAVHQHNEVESAEKLLDKLLAGESVALITDAGTPAVSDPGARVVARVRAAGVSVVPIPGPSAVVTALSASGLPEGPFLFVGFLPAKSAARRQQLEDFANTPAHLVFYEAPHRIDDAVADLLAVYGPARRVLVAKELTKRFETFHLAPLGEIAAWFEADPARRKGEFVLVVEAPVAAVAGNAHEAERVLRLLLDDGLPVKQASSLAAAITGAAKKQLYSTALAWKAAAEA